MGELIVDGFRHILMFIDDAIYSLIYICYKLILSLANINLFTDEGLMGDFAQRIYVFLGIFMIFRLGFSILQYLINPDKATDKTVGASRLIMNCIISLIFIVITPEMFKTLYEIQQVILEDNIIGKVILGTSLDSSSSKSVNELTVENAAKDTQFLLFGTFFQVDPKVLGPTEKGTEKSGPYLCENNPVLGSISMAKDLECLTAVNGLLESESLTIDHFYRYDGSGDDDKDGIIDDIRDFSNFQRIVNIEKDDQYVFRYQSIISTIAGVIVVFMLVTFCIDIAIRAIYLCFLQLIAPIPIISYMDPKQSLGQGIFHNWIKEIFTTFISLFIRLAAIFLVMYFIEMITERFFVDSAADIYYDSDFCKDCGEMNIWIYALLIIGAFLFAKKVPQYLETIFGFKSSGDMFKSPIAKMKESNLLMAGIGGLVGSVTGAGATAAGAFQTRKNLLNPDESKAKQYARLFGSTVGGLGMGFARGAKLGATSKGEHIVRNASQSAGITGRNMALRDNTKALDRAGARFRLATGMQSAYEDYENKAKGYDSFQGAVDKMEERAKSQLAKKDDRWKAAQAEREMLMTRLKNRQIGQDDYVKGLNNINSREDELIKQYIDNGGLTNKDGGINVDAELAIMRDELANINTDNHYNYDISDWDHISAGYFVEKLDEDGKPVYDESGKPVLEKVSAKDKAKKAAMDIRTSDDYKDAKAIHEAQQSGLMQKELKN